MVWQLGTSIKPYLRWHRSGLYLVESSHFRVLVSLVSGYEFFRCSKYNIYLDISKP
jgi:hypothetical protein